MTNIEARKLFSRALKLRSKAPKHLNLEIGFDFLSQDYVKVSPWNRNTEEWQIDKNGNNLYKSLMNYEEANDFLNKVEQAIKDENNAAK